MKNEITEQSKELDLYDPQFPVQFFENSIELKLNKANGIVEDIYKVVVNGSPFLAKMNKPGKNKWHLVVDASEELLKAIDEGKIKLSYSKDGKMYAQLLNTDGKFDKKLPIKKEMLSNPSDYNDLASTFQLMALQQQLESISDQIVQLDYGVQEILKGQQNDRIALYFSAVSLIMESLSVTNPKIKEDLMIQGLNLLSTSIFQLNMKLRDDILFLKNKKYNETDKKRRNLAIEEKIQSINEMYAYIHQGIILKAGIYCELDEYGPMTTVLNEYSRFIESDIKPNASILSQFDSKDTGLITGV